MHIDLATAFTLDRRHRRLKCRASVAETATRILALLLFTALVLSYFTLAPEDTSSLFGILNLVAFIPLVIVAALGSQTLAHMISAGFLAPVYARLAAHHDARLAAVQDQIQAALGQRPPEFVLRRLHAGYFPQAYVNSTGFGPSGVVTVTYADGYLSITTLQETVSG